MLKLEMSLSARDLTKAKRRAQICGLPREGVDYEGLYLVEKERADREKERGDKWEKKYKDQLKYVEELEEGVCDQQAEEEKKEGEKRKEKRRKEKRKKKKRTRKREEEKGAQKRKKARKQKKKKKRKRTREKRKRRRERGRENKQKE